MPEAVHVRAAWQAEEELFDVVVKLVVSAIGGEPVQGFGDGADVLGNRPLVVVQDDDETLGGGDDVVECFEGDAAGESGVTAEGDHVFIGSFQVAGGGHAEGGGEGGASVAGTEGVVGAFIAGEEAGGTAGLADFAEELALAAGEELMDVALVGDVEDELVPWGGEDAVERDGELDDAEIRADVAAVFRGDVDEFLADFLRELGELLNAEAFDVVGRANLVEQTERS